MELIKKRINGTLQKGYAHYNQSLWFLPKIIKGITWGDHIYLRQNKEEVSDKLIKHEMMHVRQYERMGKFKFVTRYVSQYVSSFLTRLVTGALSNIFMESYYDIDLEQEARSYNGL